MPAFIRDPTKAVADAGLKHTSFVALPRLRDNLVTGIARREDVKPLASCAAYSWPRGVKVGSKEGRVAMFLHGGESSSHRHMLS